MKELINSLKKYDVLTEQNIELIKSKAQLLSINKGGFFLKTGSVGKQLGFINEGILRVRYLNVTGEDITKAFITENRFALNFTNYINNTPSEVCFQAVCDCKLIVFHEKALLELAGAIPSWNDIIYKISLTALYHKLKRSNDMLNEDAKLRYSQFLEIYPGLANKVPLSTIASYLGINQSSLSRIRKDI
jgi:CRP-like cAMP-binding protein